MSILCFLPPYFESIYILLALSILVAGLLCVVQGVMRRFQRIRLAIPTPKRDAVFAYVSFSLMAKTCWRNFNG